MKKLIIEKDKLINNINIIKRITSSTIIAVLKGNGYGLGLLEFAQVLVENSIDFFAVSEIEEALALRNNGFKNKILLLASTSFEDEAETIIRNNLIPTVGSLNSASAINEAAKREGTVVDIHLKIDTGFGRFGFLWNKADEFLSILKSMDNLNLAGTYSHLSFSFEKESVYTYMQFERFMKCVDKMKECNVSPGMLHIANSCAFLRYPAMHLDAVRIGSAFLGRLPMDNQHGLAKIGYLRSNIIETKELPKNHFVGYANTFKTKGATRIGIVPVGYMDGFGVEKAKDTFRLRDILRYMYNDLKSLNKSLYIRLADKRKLMVLGRISMFNIVVDLTGTDAQIGDEVILEANPVLVDGRIKREYV